MVKMDNDLRNHKLITVSKHLEKNKQMLKKLMGDGQDVFERDFSIRLTNNKEISLYLTGVGGLVDEKTIRKQVVEPLLSEQVHHQFMLRGIKQRLFLKEVNEEKNFHNCLLKMIKGATILFVDGYQTALVIKAKASVERSIDEPPTGTVVSGPREGFVESLGTNIALLRKRIAHPDLKFKTYTLGEYSQTEVVITYIEGIALSEIVERADRLIRKIEVDDIASAGQVEQYLDENSYSIFPTTGNTERPDELASMIMEGRFAVLIDGDPVALYYPSLFVEKLQDVEDYSSKPFYSSFVRLLRFFAFFISIVLPSFYISAVNIHKEMIPSSFLLALEQSREGVPFPIVLETLMLLILFEIVREAGIRMPRAIGQAVSIVGALILGEVSVQAGLISAQTIIVVATATIATFIVTPIADVVALLRLFYLIPSALFGFYGLMICLLLTVTHMVNLKSMGVSYAGPIMPVHLRDWKDTVVRLPYKLLKYRPKSIPNMRPIRYKSVPQHKKKDETK